MPEFIQNPERDFLSVVIPIHPYFKSKSSKAEKAKAFEQKIIESLNEKPLTLTEISRKLGYKSISKKLSQTVKSMAEQGLIKAKIEGDSIVYEV